MRLIVTRHYRTVNNAERRIMGWDDAPPAEDFEIDLRAVDEAIRNRDIGFDAYYSSALGRARETAAFFAHKRGRPAIHCSPRLNEVNYGDLRQRPKEWVQANYPEYKTNPDFIFPRGESFTQMQRRSVNFILGLERIHQTHTLLLVLHAGVIRGLICHFLELAFASNLRRKISHQYVGAFVIENGECASYNEFGKPSGFVKDGIVDVPLLREAKGGPSPITLEASSASNRPRGKARTGHLGEVATG